MFAGVVEQLEAAISTIADIDLDALADTDLDDLVIGLQRAKHRLDGATAVPLARWDATSVWRSDGSRSAAARLSRDGMLAMRTARVELRRARKLAAMPATAAAVAAGRLSTDHVDLLARADQPHRHHLFTRDEHVLVEQCATLRHPQAVKMIEYWIQRADAETDTPPEPAPRSRLHASPTLDGTVRLDGLLDPVDGAIVHRELSRLERQQYLADQAAGVTRTSSERLAAALVEMATRSASTPNGARRPKPLFTALLGDDSVNHLCELATGTVITPGQLVPHLGVAEMETILFDGPSTVIAASPARTFTGRLRRAIEVRDRHCQHPSGCDIPAPDCDVDHTVPVTEGGVTSQFGGRIECRPHNRDATLHDHGAAPLPERAVTDLDALRALIRWRHRHEHPQDWADDDNEPAA